jgi:Tfp pilus assembly protein PilX
MLKTMNNIKGVALISTLFFLVIVTMFATGAIILSTVQLKVASSISRWERGLAVAEGSINYVVPLLKYANYDHIIPAQYCGYLTTPCVAAPGLIPEFVRQLQEDVESTHATNLRIPVGSSTAFRDFDVQVNIDASGTSIMAGGGVESSWAYHGGAYSSSLLKAYRIKSVATTPNGINKTSVCQVVWLRAIM